jgi:hypothetical protein
MRPNPSDPERTVSVAIVATRLRTERLGELHPQPGPRRIGETRIDRRSHSRIGVARKRGSLRQSEPGRERDRNERVAKVAHATTLDISGTVSATEASVSQSMPSVAIAI